MNYQQKAAQLKSITAELSKINKRYSSTIKVSPEVEHFMQGHYHIWAGIDDHDYFFDNFVYKPVGPGFKLKDMVYEMTPEEREKCGEPANEPA